MIYPEWKLMENQLMLIMIGKINPKASDSSNGWKENVICSKWAKTSKTTGILFKLCEMTFYGKTFKPI